jgi:hypothetical protein
LWKAASKLAVPIIWAAAGFMSYALLYVEPRYVGGFFLLLFVCAYSAVWLPLQASSNPHDHRASSLVLATVALSILLPLVSSVPKSAATFFAPDEHLQAAKALARMGLRSGDKLASVGAPYGEYFLRVGRFRCVAEVPDDQVSLFWQLDDVGRAQLFKQLSAAGIKAVVAGNAPQMETDTWSELGSSGYYVHLLNAP